MDILVFGHVIQQMRDTFLSIVDVLMEDCPVKESDDPKLYKDLYLIACSYVLVHFDKELATLKLKYK